MKRAVKSAKFLALVPVAIAALVLFHSTKTMSVDSKALSVEVQVDNFSFGPETLAVPLDSTVTWLNKDDVPHVIASNDGVFRSKALDTDDRYSYTFTKPGTYEYYCSIHPKMVGKIIVGQKADHGR